MKYLWNLLFYQPLYNGLFFLVGVVPQYSLFISVIILTIIVRLIISPLSYKSVKTQIKTKALQPKLAAIKKEHPEDKQEQARKTLELYKTEGVSPFSGILLMLVQLPIILALYWVFRDGSVAADPTLLYSFVSVPEQVNTSFFGMDLVDKSILLALLAGITQYIHLHFSSAMKNKPAENATEQEKMMASVGSSMKYTMPVMITFFAYTIGGAVALYWVTSNIFMIIQERVIQKRIKKQDQKTT